VNKLITSALLLLSFLGGSLSLQAADFDWQLKRDRDGIKVFTRKVDGSRFKAVRAEVVIAASLSSVVGLIRDAKACPKWADRCGQSYVHEQVGPMEEYIYTLNSMPWPVSDRDVLAHVSWSQSEQDLSVTMRSRATVGKLPKSKGVVRLEEAQASWFLTPLSATQVKVVTEAHINPGGPLPAWVTNMLLVDSPYTTLKNLRKVAVTEPYKSLQLSYLRLPEQDAP